MKKKVDIIVPIWESYEYLVECVRSVRENTKEGAYRFLFVNDASNDKRIEKFLLEQKNEKDIYISSSENLGFIKTVNIGLSIESRNDVVLLNTDTIVTKNWIENLQAAVYSDSSIAVGNPISNNASMYSIDSLKELKESEYERIQKIGEIISTKVEKLQTKVPTAVGYCMYIKRKVLEEIGKFDEIYGRGYGEENDWSMRARSKGYKIVLIGNSFVYHKGSVSMIKAGDIKPGELTKMKNEKILEKRYPNYLDDVEDFKGANLMQHWEQIISFAMNQESQQKRPKQNMLFYLHNSLNGEIIGGTELHVKDLIKGVQDNYNSCLAYVSNHTLFIDHYCEGIKTSYIFPLKTTVDKYELYSSELEQKFEYIFELFDIKAVHIHHLMYGGLSLGKACARLKIPVLLTLHDFYTISPDYNLLYKYAYGLNEKQDLKNYFRERFDLVDFCLEEWQKLMSNFLKDYADIIIVPSEITKDILYQNFEGLESIKTRVIPHGHTGRDNKGYFEYDNDKIFRVGFIGATDSVSKGREIVLEMKKLLTRDGVEMHFFGIKPDSGIGLKIGKDKNVFIHGYYNRDEIVGKLKEAKIDLAILPSIWPETFGYTLTEAWLADIPVLVSPLGALSERVKASGGGEIIEDLSPSSFVDAIKRLKHDSKTLREYKEEIKKIDLISIDQMAAQYKEIYSSFIDEDEAYKIEKFGKIENHLNFYGNPRKQVMKYRSLERTYLGLVGGRLWRFLDKTYYKLRKVLFRY